MVLYFRDNQFYAFLMQPMNVLFLGNNDPSNYRSFFGNFAEKLGLSTAAGYEVSSVKTDLELISTIGQPTLPQIIFIDADPKYDRYNLDELYTIASNLKSLDPQIFTLFVLHTELSPALTMNGVQRGVDAFVSWNCNFAVAKEMILEALTTKLDHFRKQLRAPVRHKIRISIASIAQAVVAETLNVGTGGMFVRSLPQNIQKGDAVDFEFLLGGPLSFDSGSEQDNPLDELEKTSSQSLKGSGWVVWIRPTPKESLPEGMGIQFSNLETETQQLIEDYIRNHKIQSFIPNS